MAADLLFAFSVYFILVGPPLFTLAWLYRPGRS